MDTRGIYRFSSETANQQSISWVGEICLFRLSVHVSVVLTVSLLCAQLGQTAEKLVSQMGTRPMLVAAIFVMGILGLISIASAWGSMGSRTQG
jgi:hypothetical protein